VPDVVVFFAVNLAPLLGSLTVANVVALPAFLQSSAASFAALIGVPPAQLYAVNITDLATGAFVPVGSVRRQLAGAGSQGVAVTYVVRLGKTPTEKAVVNITAVLASPATIAPVLRAVTAQLGAATQLGAAAFTVAVPASSIAIANAGFTVSGPTVVTDAAAAGGSSSNVGGAAGGAAGGIAALFLGVWVWRSYSKHKTLPCCRDRRSELLSKSEVSRAIAEAEAVLEKEPAAAPSPGLAPARPKGPKGGAQQQQQSALIVRKLAQESAAAKAEVLALRKQLAAAKQAEAGAPPPDAQRAAAKPDDDDLDAAELAQIKAQLRAAKAAAKAAKAAAPAPEAAVTVNPIAFAPRPVE